ncbi:archaellum component FlaG (FlaF/FlaG flagellin family) [Deinobacterium chartae]|uniref:Archaellum component FlaG (FlaF/FlaG flagellin family) n=1 Tax=Deinobacterium chartae TaxID=521158 RepID=A0A841I150_9DEIO|nr:PEGA domain-containing protein [Deinobacterium chartae]MBB6099531.1 archaellum component FlaG (FlaF/FlaG flagellin family) [Deinobacterium chartae]
MKKLVLSGLLLVSGAAFGQARISPQSIIVNPTPPAPTELGVNVWTDKDPSGNGSPDYYPGEHIRLYVSTTRDAYVYLFNVDPNGKVDLILPNRYSGGENFVKANTVKVFPPEGAGFTFDIAAPYGQNKVLALASKTPLNLDEIARFQSNQNSGFAEVTVKSQAGLAQALSIVVNPVPQNSWITDTALYNVANRRPQTGSVQFQSNPAGANVYVDGRLIGRTPTSVANLTAGRHDVRISLPGYLEYSTTLNVGRDPQTVRVDLRPEVRQGSLQIDSNVQGAEVYINDRRAGRAPGNFANLNEGSYRVRVTAPGYEDYTTTVNVRAGTTVTVNAQLRSEQSRVTLRSNVEGAVVFVNGRQMGTISRGGLSLTLDRGVYEFVVIAPGYRTSVSRVELRADVTLTTNLSRL